MSEIIRLSNDTKVELNELSDQDLVNLVEEREDSIKLQQNTDRIAEMQRDVDTFIGEIARRHRAYSAECNDSENI